LALRSRTPSRPLRPGRSPPRRRARVRRGVALPGSKCPDTAQPARPAPPPGQRFSFPAGGRKRIPHPKGNGGKHIGKIVSLPPRTPPRRAAEIAWHRRGGGGGCGLGKGHPCHRSRHPPPGRTGPPWAPRPIRADQRTNSISAPGSLPILIVQPHQEVEAGEGQEDQGQVRHKHQGPAGDHPSAAYDLP
jgi:hypothetical protein